MAMNPGSRFSFAVGLLALVFGLGVSGDIPLKGREPQFKASSRLHLDVKERVLENGVTVLVWERPGAGRIGARVFYRVDVAAERPGTVGLVHMLEHFLFMGSHRVGTSDWEAERPYAEAVERIEREITDERNRNAACFLQRDVFAEVEVECRTPRLDALQAELDEAFAGQQRYARGTDFDWIYQPAGGTGLTASTGPDWMKFDIDLPVSALELFMWMERSRVENPVFRFFEPEREVVVDQIRRYDNRPDGPFERVLRSLTYDAHPYGWAHWFSDLTRATREDHWEIFYRYFIPQNTVIVVVGDVEAEEVFRQAERYWANWLKGRPSPRLRTVEPPPVGEKRFEAEAPAGPAFVLHVPMPAVGHPDAPVFQVMAEILAGERGLLETELVDVRGIASGVRAAASPAKYPSHMTIRINARRNDDLPAAEEGVESVLARIAAGKLDPALPVAAVDRMILSMARGLERIGPAAVQIGAMEAIYGWRHLNELPGKWAGVTVNDLARVVETYFPKSMRTTGVLRRAEAEVPAAPASTAFEMDVRAAGDADGTDGVWAWEPPRRRLHIPLALRETREGGSEGVEIAVSVGGAGTAVATGADDGTRVRDDETIPRSGALAEMPWYAPPWMAGYRPSRFTDEPPVETWRTLMPAPEAPRLPEAGDVRRELAGGYRAHMAPDDLLPLVQITALVRARTMDDIAGEEGLAELVAGTLARGGTAELDPDAFETRLRAIGARLSVRVDPHHTRFHLLAPPEGAAEAARILAALMHAPRLDAGVLTQERDRMAVSAERRLDDAAAVLSHAFHSTLFPEAHPLARIPTGASVRTLNRDKAVAYHRASYGAEGVVFALSGRFDAEEMETAMNEALIEPAAAPADVTGLSDSDPVSAEEPPSRALAPAFGGGVRIVTRELPTRQAHVMLGHRGLADLPDDPREHAALELMNYILSGGAFVSRMMELLRTDTGITSALYGSVEPGGDIPFPYVWRFSGNPETLAWGIRLAVEEIERMRREGVTEEEFEGARISYLQGLIPDAYETPQRSVERFAQKALLGRYLYQSPGYLNYYAGDEEQVAALQSLTVEDINAAARRHLHPEELVIAVVGPLDEIRAGAGPEDLRWVTLRPEDP